MRWFFFLLALVMIPSVAVAQPIESIPPGEDVIVPIKKGLPSPIAGQVFSAETALRWANWIQQYRARLALDVQKEKDVCKVETTHRDSLLVIERTRSSSVEKDLQARLLRAEEARLKAEEALRSPPFYKTTEFGMIMGAVLMTGVFALSVWAVEATTSAE